MPLLFLAAAASACTQGESAGCIAPTDGAMTWIPAGTFRMGEDPRYPEEGPPRLVSVPGFWMSVHEITNREFAAFVEATGYRTVAERAPPDFAAPGSAVFTVPDEQDRRWWRWVEGASWRAPSGPGSAIAGRETDPVVQIAWEDAEAYARWKGLSLPTEEQWEYAARAGAAALPEPVQPDGTASANYYQGSFPDSDLGLDGYRSRAPAGCFPANAFGLHDMIGNVWEWTRSADPRVPGTRTIKGGSFLCAANYCARYRPAARQFQELGLGTDHIGFRLVDARRPPPSSAGNGAR
jgi:formylglycine-generating enzyme required for sulfatase activity